MRITAIITTYNRSHLIDETIESVLAQTRPADEVIVVDDGSTDDTLACVKAYEGRVRILAKENGGVSSARNAGIQAASGEWVTFLDDDDLWYPERLAVFERDMAGADPDIAVHLANVRLVGRGYVHDKLELAGVEAPRGRAVRIDDIFLKAIGGFHLNGLACKREVALEIGGFDEALRSHGDALFCGLLGYRRPWMVTSDFVADVRRIEGDTNSIMQVSSRNPTRRYADRLHANTRFSALDLTPTERRRLRQGRHFVFLRYGAALLSLGQKKEARAALAEAARAHPSPLKGWIKILPVLAMGQRGLTMLGDKRFER